MQDRDTREERVRNGISDDALPQIVDRVFLAKEVDDLEHGLALFVVVIKPCDA